MKVLITGGQGYIARELSKGLVGHSLTLVSRSDFDLLNLISLKEWVKDKEFDVVIHTAAKGASSHSSSTFSDNVCMFNNLLAVRRHFGRLINLGSGAEIFSPETPYGASKLVIANQIRENDEFFNVRIFAVFNENELPTRFIKANILRHLSNSPMLVYENRAMDFFYMGDLVNLIQFYIEEAKPAKEIDCSYPESVELLSLARKINLCGTHVVPIEFSGKTASRYCGKSNLPIPVIGLDNALKDVYNRICLAQR